MNKIHKVSGVNSASLNSAFLNFPPPQKCLKQTFNVIQVYVYSIKLYQVFEPLSLQNMKAILMKIEMMRIGVRFRLQ